MNSSTDKLFTAGYVLAGLANIVGILVVSSGFSSHLFHRLYPEVFNQFGALMIMVWGLAYLAAAPKAAHLGGLALVFAVEKFIYVATWLHWISDKSEMLDMVRMQSSTVALFYQTYGLLDLSFGLFFLITAWRAFRR